MCGNGGRCIVALAHRLGIIDTYAKFLATDGAHIAVIKDISKFNIVVNLKMKDVSHFEDQGDHFIIDTGSPHYVKFVHDLALMDVYKEGKTIRHSSKFITNGINVNFVEVQNENIFVRTFERGVENETLSCGTGIIASVLAHSIKNKIKRSPLPVRTLGGNLNIYFKRGRSNFYDIWIEGPAVLVFKGQIRY
jgi:diaminopimelate epimerase